MEVLLILTTVVSVAISTLSALYIWRTPRAIVGRSQLFGLFITNAVLIAEDCASLLAIGELQLWLARISMVLAIIALYFTYVFARSILLQRSVQSTPLAIAGILVAISALTPWFFSGIKLNDSGYAAPVPEILTIGFLLYTSFVVLSAAIQLLSTFRDKQRSLLTRKTSLLYGVIHIFTYTYLFLFIFLYSNTIGDARFLYLAGLIIALQTIALMYVYTRYSLQNLQQLIASPISRVSIVIFMAIIPISLLYLLQNVTTIPVVLLLALQLASIVFSVWVLMVLFRWLDTRETTSLQEYVKPLTTELTQSILKTIVDGVATKLEKEYGVTNFELFLLDYEREQFVEYGVNVNGSTTQRAFPQEHPLIKTLSADKRGLRASVLDLRHMNETKLLEDSSASVAIPLHTNQGVYGVVLVNEANELSEDDMTKLIDDYTNHGYEVGQHLEYVLRNHYIVTSTSEPRD